MIPVAAEQLLLDIAEYRDKVERRAFGNKSGGNKEQVQENPVAYLVSMLLVIKKELPDISAMLSSTVRMASYDRYLEEAKKLLGKNNK
mgnify:FL=1